MKCPTCKDKNAHQMVGSYLPLHNKELAEALHGKQVRISFGPVR